MSNIETLISDEPVFSMRFSVLGLVGDQLRSELERLLIIVCWDIGNQSLTEGFFLYLKGGLANIHQIAAHRKDSDSP